VHTARVMGRCRRSPLARRLLQTCAATAGLAGTIVLFGVAPSGVSASSPGASARAVVPHGLQSAAALSGYQVVAQKFDNVPNFTRVTVNCPSGKVVIGGGAEAQGVNSILNGSFPAPGSTGWIGIGHQPGYSSLGIMVYAICAVVS
jgi:hypothetical protein